MNLRHGWGLSLAALLVMPGCFEDRPRPSPVESGTPAQVRVTVLRPAGNTTLLAGRTTVIDVEADGGGRSLTALGYVAWTLQGGGRVDSVVVAFEPRLAARDSFQLLIPAQLPTNTHLSINGLAFLAGGGVRYSPATLAVVAQCTPDIPACR